MSKRLVLIMLLVVLVVSLVGAKGKDDFLGIWALKDNSMTIKIIKEGTLYYVIEFVRIKHELFFSGDETKALFIEYGKGPDWTTIMLQVDGNTITDMYFSEKYIWEPTQYTYYKKP
jgi:hypothetical protein